MATYKSKHTGERVDNAVTKIPENLPTEDSFIVVKADGSASEYVPQSQVLSDKLDKQTAQTTSDQIYGKLADGSQTMFDVTMGAEPTTIPRRDTAGRIQVADGVSGNDAVNFKQLSAVESSISGLNIQNGDGKDSIQSKYTGEIDATHFGNHCYGESAAVIGEANLNTGNRATVSGKMNRNSAPNSLIVGLGNGRGINANPTINVLSGEQLFVFGSLNSVLNGNGNVVLGAENTLSDVRYTTLIGRGNIIDSTSLYEGKCVVGRFNNQKPDTMFEVGVGDYNNRVNGFEVYKDGRAKVQTAPKDNDDVVRKLELDRKFDKAGGTVTGNMVVGGNFTVQGRTTTVDSENLRITDKLIEVGKGNTAPLTSPAGLFTPKYDGQNNGGIVYDNTGTAYVGDITLDSNGNVDVNNSDLQPIATRNATITNDNLVKWDGTNHKLVDSGKKIGDLSTATNLENGTGTGSLVQTNVVSSSGTPYTNRATGSGAIALGKNCWSGGNTAFTIGQQNKTGNNSGTGDSNSGKGGFTHGYNNINEGHYTEVGGSGNIVEGAGADTIVNGRNNYIIKSNHSAVFGDTNRVDGTYNPNNGADDNIVGGKNNNVGSSGNIVGGESNTARGNNNSLIIGSHNSIDTNSSGDRIVGGHYNKPVANGLMEIGNGTSNTDRKNAFVVLEDGRAKVQAAPTENNDVLRYQDTAVEVETSLMGA